MPRTHGRSTEVRLEAVKRHGDSPTYAYDGHRRQGGEPNPGSSKRKRARTIPSLRNHATRGDRGDETTIAVRTKKKALPGDRKKRGRGASAVAKRRAEVLAVTRKMPRDHVSPSKKRTFHRAQPWAEDSIAGGEPSLPLGAPVAPIGIFATTTEKTPCRAVFPTEPFAGKKRTGTGIDRCCHRPNHSLRSLHIGKAIRSSWIAG